MCLVPFIFQCFPRIATSPFDPTDFAQTHDGVRHLDQTAVSVARLSPLGPIQKSSVCNPRAVAVAEGRESRAPGRRAGFTGGHGYGSQGPPR